MQQNFSKAISVHSLCLRYWFKEIKNDKKTSQNTLP